MWRVGPPYYQFQRSGDLLAQERIISTYQTMYEAFFEERRLIPQGRFCEIDFESLEREPLTQIERIYETLGLSGFPSLRASLESYVASIAQYRKNEYPALPGPMRQRISTQWRRSFQEWGYAD
jgi:hypothetical protein